MFWQNDAPSILEEDIRMSLISTNKTHKREEILRKKVSSPTPFFGLKTKILIKNFYKIKFFEQSLKNRVRTKSSQTLQGY